MSLNPNETNLVSAHYRPEGREAEDCVAVLMHTDSCEFHARLSLAQAGRLVNSLISAMDDLRLEMVRRSKLSIAA
jgi:hypothetical protein